MTDRKRQAPNAAEWTVFSVAAVLVLVVVAVLVADWASESSDPPAFGVSVKRTMEIGSLHHVEVEVVNTGGEAAGEATVSAELDTGDDAVELDEVITFLAPDEKTTVTFIFEDDPAEGDLTVDVSSYREP